MYLPVPGFEPTPSEFLDKYVNARLQWQISEAGMYQSFSGLPNYSKNFYLSWCCSNFQTKSNPFPTGFKTISNPNNMSSVEKL